MLIQICGKHERNDERIWSDTDIHSRRRLFGRFRRRQCGSLVPFVPFGSGDNSDRHTSTSKGLLTAYDVMTHGEVKAWLRSF